MVSRPRFGSPVPQGMLRAPWGHVGHQKHTDRSEGGHADGDRHHSVGRVRIASCGEAGSCSLRPANLLIRLRTLESQPGGRNSGTSTSGQIRSVYSAKSQNKSIMSATAL